MIFLICVSATYFCENALSATAELKTKQMNYKGNGQRTETEI